MPTVLPGNDRARRGRVRVRRAARWLYVWAVLREFRVTLALLGAAVAFAAFVYRVCPGPQRPFTPLPLAFYGAWMTLLAQPLDSPPANGWLMLLCGAYPLLGFLLIGEGVVRLALLVVSKRQGERQWMQVMASTYRDHVILCGLGHLGYRVLEALVAGQVPVVVLEKRRDSRHLTHARELGVPVLLRDMKEDQALLDAGIARAAAVVIATNDDMANLEVALDARRLNPRVRVVMRLFDQEIAAKISGALSIDAAFSSSALAAPMVAALSLGSKVVSSYVIAGVAHVAAETTVAAGSALDGKRISEVELGYAARVLARQAGGSEALESPPTPGTVLGGGDVLVVHTAAAQLATLLAAGRGEMQKSECRMQN